MASAADRLIDVPVRDAYDQWLKTPGPQTNAQVLRALRPTIDKAIRTHVGRVDPLLRSRGRSLALEALRSYDPTRGVRLNTHLHNRLQGIRRYATRQQQVLSVPERVVLDRRVAHTAGRALEVELGREPTLDELADRTGLSATRLRRARQAAMPVAEGYLASLSEGGLAPAVARQGTSQAWLQIVYDDLGPTDKKIMEWTFGMGGQPKLTNQEIARRLGRTPGAISQRKLLIQRTLDQETALSPFV